MTLLHCSYLICIYLFHWSSLLTYYQGRTKYYNGVNRHMTLRTRRSLCLPVQFDFLWTQMHVKSLTHELIEPYTWTDEIDKDICFFWRINFGKGDYVTQCILNVFCFATYSSSLKTSLKYVHPHRSQWFILSLLSALKAVHRMSYKYSTDARTFQLT